MSICELKFFFFKLYGTSVVVPLNIDPGPAPSCQDYWLLLLLQIT